MFREIREHGGANDIDSQLVFAGVLECTFGEFRRHSVSAKRLGNFGVLEREHAGSEGVFEIGDMTLALELKAPGCDLLWLLLRAEHSGNYNGKLLLVVRDWVPPVVAFVVPGTPRGGIMRQALPRNIAKRLEHPVVGFRIERSIFGEIEQPRHGTAPLLFAEHSRLRQSTS